MGMNNDTKQTGTQEVTIKGEKIKVLITIGYVQVYTGLRDCEGWTRTIDFPRMGRLGVSRKAKCHFSLQPWIDSAYRAAITAMAIASKKGTLAA